MRSTKQRADPTPPPPTHPTQRLCNAFGCPEVGSISHSNAGQAPEDSWFCRWHFGEPSDRWPEITRERRIERSAEAA